MIWSQKTFQQSDTIDEQRFSLQNEYIERFSKTAPPLKPTTVYECHVVLGSP